MDGSIEHKTDRYGRVSEPPKSSRYSKGLNILSRVLCHLSEYDAIQSRYLPTPGDPPPSEPTAYFTRRTHAKEHHL